LIHFGGWELWGTSPTGADFAGLGKVAFQIRGGAGWPAWNVQAR
jgi:hypothetical protein